MGFLKMGIALLVVISGMQVASAVEITDENKCLTEHLSPFKKASMRPVALQVWERHQIGVEAPELNHEGDGICYSAPKIYGDTAEEAIVMEHVGTGNDRGHPVYLKKLGQKHVGIFFWNGEWGWDEKSCRRIQAFRRNMAEEWFATSESSYDSETKLYSYVDKTLRIPETREIRLDPINGGLTLRFANATYPYHVVCYFPR